MPKVKADISHSTIDEKVDLGKSRSEALTGNLEVPVDVAKLAAYDTGTTNLETAKLETAASLTVYTNKVSIQDAAEEEYDRQTNIMVSEINSTTDDETKLTTTGFPLSDVGGDAPPVVLVKVENVSASVGDIAGSVDIHWNPLKKVDGYLLEFRPDSGFPPATTQKQGTGRTSKYTLTGLSSGDYIWIRVSALKGTEQGPPSDPATSIVP